MLHSLPVAQYLLFPAHLHPAGRFQGAPVERGVLLFEEGDLEVAQNDGDDVTHELHILILLGGLDYLEFHPLRQLLLALATQQVH